ncbi:MULTISPECIES: glutathione S-transferase family protein [Prochlorococcus]|uniref:Glutaredoxin-like domain fused to phycoerythrin related domain n=2 Tax=Prochlorococcus marinus TaxID=1219 RepID=G3XCR7_PROMA|nr:MULTISPECIES: glutathione S-transferase family protein [Prochlorococcus]AAC15823.1 unknown [Prochlorococcus marinus]AAP99613.1 Glutaredoxin-like domain fused to phycoerythrin related domain [Prochlorococcus marinus subsp. marinus str. CCMP1375]KGG11117.1 Glutaredoxin-like domain/phycoerythrin related domain fusion [Prochlorococcus marinus str. LG]KGG21455.1 Glutaredoxin-like domain/phycoerythrin related domain fusion [Prochlorococcus marinus str. SS2]KGG23200.1 Glutaredoxin-like domain/phyc
MKEAIAALSWEELTKFAHNQSDLINGPNNSYSLLRLFGQNKSSIRVVFFRDKHAWCPYCQKVWLWLELKKIPYAVKKVTMRCYGEKEKWYLKKVPSGLFPAIEIDQELITESDKILLHLEKTFGPLGMQMEHPKIIDLRNLERNLFRSWCIWLCNPSFSKVQSIEREKQFKFIAKEVDNRLSQTNSPWIDPSISNSLESLPGSIDVAFVPYLERMNASLAYYKGIKIRKEFPNIDRWFKSLEILPEYRGTQGDFHTHSHDLPPQMGGCWLDKNVLQETFSNQIDIGNGLGENETTFEPSTKTLPSAIALTRVLKHREGIKAVNPLGPESFDQPLRAALSYMISKQDFIPTQGSAVGLRYLRDRVSVPRDMPLLAAREFRKALEKTAQIDGSEKGAPLPTRHRFDQNPIYFSKAIDN